MIIVLRNSVFFYIRRHPICVTNFSSSLFGILEAESCYPFQVSEFDETLATSETIRGTNLLLIPPRAEEAWGQSRQRGISSE